MKKLLNYFLLWGVSILLATCSSENEEMLPTNNDVLKTFAVLKSLNQEAVMDLMHLGGRGWKRKLEELQINAKFKVRFLQFSSFFLNLQKSSHPELGHEQWEMRTDTWTTAYSSTCRLVSISGKQSWMGFTSLAPRVLSLF